MSERATLRRLYRAIPEMSCKPGCQDCCGPVPLSPAEARRLGVDGVTTAGSDSLTCRFARKEGGCSVYAQRPLLCRLFAIGPAALACPHGCQAKHPLSELKAHAIRAEYVALSPNAGPDQMILDAAGISAASNVLADDPLAALLRSRR